jgi:hypothetical protein
MIAPDACYESMKADGAINGRDPAQSHDSLVELRLAAALWLFQTDSIERVLRVA